MLLGIFFFTTPEIRIDSHLLRFLTELGKVHHSGWNSVMKLPGLDLFSPPGPRFFCFLGFFFFFAYEIDALLHHLLLWLRTSKENCTPALRPEAQHSDPTPTPHPATGLRLLLLPPQEGKSYSRSIREGSRNVRKARRHNRMACCYDSTLFFSALYFSASEN